jgi:hypothetical protein
MEKDGLIRIHNDILTSHYLKENYSWSKIGLTIAAAISAVGRTTAPDYGARRKDDTLAETDQDGNEMHTP